MRSWPGFPRASSATCGRGAERDVAERAAHGPADGGAHDGREPPLARRHRCCRRLYRRQHRRGGAIVREALPGGTFQRGLRPLLPCQRRLAPGGLHRAAERRLSGPGELHVHARDGGRGDVLRGASHASPSRRIGRDSDGHRARLDAQGRDVMIRIGIIGYGYWGPNLVRNLVATLGAEVVAVADLDSAKLATLQRRFPAVAVSTDFQQLVNDPSIDAIAVATPVSTHFQLGMAALRAGKHLWLEKPMAETSFQAHKLVDEAERRRKVLFVDHTFIYTGAVRKMAEIIKAGALGRIFYYDSIRVNLGLFQRDVNVISDLGVHDFSILEHLLGEHPVAVSASGINHFPGTPESLAYISLFYDSGTIAHANVSWLAPVTVRQILIGGSMKLII